jgi:hypothetical protein
MRAPLIVMLVLVGACEYAPEQDSSFCADNEDCGEGQVCNAFTKRCRVNLNVARTDVDMWGDFFCFSPTEGETTLGSFNLAFGHRAGPHIGVDIPEGRFVLRRAACSFRHHSADDLFQLFTAEFQLEDGGPRLTFSTVLRGAVARDVGVQTEPLPSTYTLALQGPTGEVLLGTRSARVSLEEVAFDATPQRIRGEFEGTIE